MLEKEKLKETFSLFFKDNLQYFEKKLKEDINQLIQI